jgi:hypothetical protein
MNNIPAQRLHQQQISAASPHPPEQILAMLGAIQGQDYTGAKWSLGLRSQGATDADIEAAMADSRIVRTWLMRGTLHLVAAADFHWMLNLLAPRLIESFAPRYRQLELDSDTFTRSNALLIEALAGGLALSRHELFAVLEQHGVSTAGQRGIHILQRASLDGLLYQAAVVKNQPIFRRVDEGLPAQAPLMRDAALVELARRYFTSRAPATLQDYATWSGLKMSDARAGLECVQPQLMAEDINGQTYWRPIADPVTPQASPTAYLLPGFDEYLLGYKDRDAVLPRHHAPKVCPGGNGIFYPTLVLDGQMVGLWQRTLKKTAVELTFTPFDAPFTAAEQVTFL